MKMFLNKFLKVFLECILQTRGCNKDEEILNLGHNLLTITLKEEKKEVKMMQLDQQSSNRKQEIGIAPPTKKTSVEDAEINASSNLQNMHIRIYVFSASISVTNS